MVKVLSQGKPNEDRRRLRTSARKWRASGARSVSNLGSSAHRTCVRCCARLRGRVCLCDDTKFSCNAAQWKKLIAFADKCPVRTYNDCIDDDAFHEYVEDKSGTALYAWWLLTVIFAYSRHQWPPTWEDLQEAFPRNSEPRWELLAKRLQQKHKSGTPFNNGNFRKSHVTQYRMDIGGGSSRKEKWQDAWCPPEKWKDATKVPEWKRDFIAMKCGWFAALAAARSLALYRRVPSTASFGTFVATWRAALCTRMNGCVGDYCMKRCLDLIVASGIVSREHVSTWPTDCPAYNIGLKCLFRGLAPQDKEDALFYIWRHWPRPQGLCVGEVAMVLCWWLMPKCKLRLLTER